MSADQKDTQIISRLWVVDEDGNRHPYTPELLAA